MWELKIMNNKTKIRFIFFLIVTLISYLVCTISLFFTKDFFIPAISFIVLFLSIYFLALDCYKRSQLRIFLTLFILFVIETIVFIIFQWFSVYLILELILFHAALWSLLLLLIRQLKHRTTFSPFSYFTEWWFIVTTLLTIFFCVLMMWKYTQIPFTCDEIESFPDKIVETTVNPFKKTWNKITSFFTNEKEPEPLIEPLKWISNPLTKSKDLESADNVEQFFTNVRGYIKDQSETLNIKSEISKTTCEYTISILQKIQQSEWIQIAAIVLAYFILVWIFKILLRIISFIWFWLFIILRIFWVYKYEKQMVEKEMIA